MCPPDRNQETTRLHIGHQKQDWNTARQEHPAAIRCGSGSIKGGTIMRRRSEGNSEGDWIERRDEAAPEEPKQQE